MIKFNTAKTLFAAAALAIVPAAAHAETVSTSVSYADLDLSSPQGQATLKTRIAMAVNTVCGSANGAIDLAQRMEVNKCRSAAMHNAFAQAKLNQPVLASR